MIVNVSGLVQLLARYVSHQLGLATFHDELSLSLQSFLDNASEEDVELLSEIHSALYQVEDGALSEDEFRQALKKLIESHLSSSVITVGQPPSPSYTCFPTVATSSSTDSEVYLYAA